jgi:hypothetical protein
VALFRAVSADELTDLRDEGRFRDGPNSLGGKWFAESVEDARRWGELLGDDPFHLVRIVVPALRANVHRNARLDGIGPARFFAVAELQGVIAEVVE